MAIKSRKETELKVAGSRLPIKVNGKQTNVWIDSGSTISIFTIGELKRTLGTAGVKVKAPAPEDEEFRDYGNNPLRLLGTMDVLLETNGWVINANIRVIGGSRPSIIGRDLMPNLGLQIVQMAPEGNVMSVQSDQGTVEETDVEDSLDNWQIYFSKQFENLFNRVGKIKNYKVHADFFETLTPIQQKGRRVPITLQEKVDKEIDKLLRQGHIEKLKECSDKYFVSPIVITVKKDGSVKLALESRELNKQVHKNKYQMPNIEELMDTVGQTISERKSGDINFSTMDLTYAYGQLPLSSETSVQCNFSLVGGKSTGTYRFRAGFYGLTTMPAEFQRVMDTILAEFPQAHAFIDDILVVTKGTEIEHISTVEKILRKLDRENMALKLIKCQFARKECEWLGHKITRTGVTPLVRKIDPIESLKAPKTVSQLKSFMGSIHSLHKYLPALAESSASLRPLLSRKNDFVWSDECQISFENLKKQVANIVELRHFDIHRDTRIVCDASHNGLGAVLEQLNSDGWRPISFASRYLNAAEKNYSTNELEMLAVVWGAEYFRNYVLGRKFLIVTDHKALVSLLNGNNKKNKTMFSRLTRWLDRLIPFDFQVEHKPGAKIGLADYLSRHPCLNPQPISTYDSMFTVAKISRIRSTLGFRNKLESPSVTKNRRICNISNRKRPVEGERSCDGNWTNHKATNCIPGRSIEFSKNSVGTIIEVNFGYSKSLNSPININNSSNLTTERKLKKLLERHPSISSSDDIEEIDVNIQAVTTEVRSTKTNTIISIPSVYPGESYPPVNPENKVMSIIPRNCKVVSKQSALPELFNLRFIESQYQSDPQLQAIIELIKSKDPQLHSKIAAMSKYFAQYTQDFHVRDGCLWMDERLVIPNTLQTAVVNRLHYYHHGKSSMIDAAKDIWYPYMFRSLATIARNCPECTLAGKNLKNMCSKDDIGKIPEPKEPNESVQLDFWGPINYLKESKKYVLVAVDRFSRWPSAMVCNSNRSDKIIKFLKAYIIAHGVPRQIRVDQGTNFMSKEVKTFCHEQGIEVLISPANDHRATGCVERTIGSIKNSVLTYAREDKPEPLDRMVERALGALRFVKNASLNITPFEAHHGREANTVLRNLTKKPTLRNLNWENVIRSKYECLDERDPIAQTMPKPMAGQLKRH